MSAVQINGQEVRHGDIVVLMASPDPGSFKNSTNTYSVVTYSDDAIGGHRHNFNEISRIALQALLSPHDAVGLATAVRERREALEAADAVGIFALIFKPLYAAPARRMISGTMIYDGMIGARTQAAGPTGLAEPQDFRAVNINSQIDFNRLAEFLNREAGLL